ncbi:MAG TPA: DMT family transporter [Bradyrhizobium sp.]
MTTAITAVRSDRAGYRLGLLLVTLATVSWSAAGFFTRLIALDSWTILFWRAVFGSATCLVFIAWQERGHMLRPFLGVGRAGWLLAIVSALGMTAFLSALRLTTVAHVSIIYATIPFVAAVMAWVALGERSTLATMTASAVACAGVVLMVAAGPGEGSAAGDLLAVAMTLLMGVMIVISRGHPSLPMVPVSCLSAVLAGLVAASFAQLGGLSGHALFYLALFGTTNMGLGLIMFMIGSRMIPAGESALVGALEAPLGPLWVWLAFGETPAPTTIAGGGLVLAAVVGHVLLTTRRPPQA